MTELRDKRILVTGGGGFLGRHLVDALVRHGASREKIALPQFPDVDLRREEDCARAVAGQDVVIHLAANVGGIGYNLAKPGELFYDNMIMGAHLIDAAYRAGVKKYVQLATICAYPKFTPVPFKEENLWNGYPEETNAPYGLAKKALTVLAHAYHAQYGFNAVSLLPVNLYGPHDSFGTERAHVIPALIEKMYDAVREGKPSMEAWGTGRPTREFLYVEDAAEGIALATQRYDEPDPVNLGSGREISIRDLTHLIAGYMGFKGEITWDASKPDGQPRRMLDTSRAYREFGFRAKTSFEEGLQKTIEWYRASRGAAA